MLNRNCMEEKFTSFLNILMKVFFSIILIGSIIMFFSSFINLPFSQILYLIISNLILVAVFSLMGFVIYKIYKKGYSEKSILLIILFFSLLLRVGYALWIDVNPTSDFKMIYEAGQLFADGDFSIFKGTTYIARFPHLTLITMYFGMMIKLLPDPLTGIVVINVILSTLNVYIIYLISNEIYEDKRKSIITAFIACIFPAFIFYNSVLCSENLAMTFYLLSIYIFFLVVKNKKSIHWILLVGLLLSIGNLFRMVGYVILIAYIMYILIYYAKKRRILMSLLLVASFLLPLVSVSTLLIKQDVTEYPLWKGREPAITSILRGSNIESMGMWNEEDSKLAKRHDFDYNNVESACKTVIKDRLTTTPAHKLVGFFFVKYIGQWSNGDFSGAQWSTGELSILNSSLTLSTVLYSYAQIFYILLILSITKKLYKKEMLENKWVNLLYIIFCGFALLFLITEMQPRYGYIISWVFILLAPQIFTKKLSKK